MNIDIKEFESLCIDIPSSISLLSNASAYLNERIEDINWVGFYLLQNNELVLGPFQGKVACTKIAIGKGVCGTAVKEKNIINVNDVHTFKGHIACDSRTNSEIVLPLIYNDKCYGVLDIDSLSFNRFSKNDEEILQKIADIISKNLSLL